MDREQLERLILEAQRLYAQVMPPESSAAFIARYLANNLEVADVRRR